MVDQSSSLGETVPNDLRSESVRSHSTLGSRPEGTSKRSPEFEEHLDEIRRRLASGGNYLFTFLEDQLCKKLRLTPLSAAATGLTVLVAVGFRLALALFATASFGDWSDIPWARWAVVLAFFGFFEAVTPWMNRPLDAPPSHLAGRLVGQWTALLPTLKSESDLRDVAAFTRRWDRLPPVVVVGAVVAATMLSACWLFAPAATGALPAGTIVLLALLLYEVGEGIVHQGVFRTMFLAREARYQHDLFWPSPVDTPHVRVALRMGTGFGLISGVWISLYLAMTVVLVGWASPVVVPLAGGFILLGYLLTIGATLINRSSIRAIVERSRDHWMAALQRRIEEFGPPVTQRDDEDAERLARLIALHNVIRDAPSGPTRTRTVVRAAGGMIIPTIVFIITVFGEVYAERVLDTILP